MKYATLGTVTEGTLRNADLLEAFADELEYHVTRNAELPLAERERLTALVWDAREVEEADADDETHGILAELETELNAFAGPYCYFGAAEGDGADFGYWPLIGEINELPRIAEPDAAAARALGADCAYVNDHGNITVFGANGEVLIELV